MKKFLIVAVLFWGLSSFIMVEPSEYPFFQGETVTQKIAVSTENELVVVSRADSLPMFFYEDIFTGVCQDSLCYPAELRVFWDASGEFLGFQLPKETPLTKTGHKPFSLYEYYQLFVLLNNPNSALKKIKAEDLTQKNAKHDVDATSGATITIDRDATVKGAIYTCHTLYHIVNDSVRKNAMLAYSKSYFSQSIPAEETVKTADLLTMTEGELALLLNQLSEIKKLKRYRVQKRLVKQMTNISPLKALILNNHINQLDYVDPLISERILECPNIESSFIAMLNGVVELKE